MKAKKIIQTTPGPVILSARERMERTERNPELIEKFYKQIINSFGYAYPTKI
jgi:hypothetical protein